jgi:hypothetical protein
MICAVLMSLVIFMNLSTEVKLEVAFCMIWKLWISVAWLIEYAALCSLSPSMLSSLDGRSLFLFHLLVCNPTQMIINNALALFLFLEMEIAF